MIRSFKCTDTQALHGRQRVKRFVSIEAVARRKLRQLELAARLEDLRIPPGNRLEALKGDRVGRHSIRINETISGGCASSGGKAARKTSRSWTTTEGAER